MPYALTGLGDSRICRSPQGNVSCTPDPGVPAGWTFAPSPLADGTYNPAYVDSQGTTWGLLGGSGYIQTARANGSQIVVSPATGNSYGGPPAHPFAPGGGVIGEPTYPAPTPPVIGPGGVVVPSSAPAAYSTGSTAPIVVSSSAPPANQTQIVTSSSAPPPAAPSAPSAPAAGFNLSSIPWWGWAAGAGLAYFAFGRK